MGLDDNPAASNANSNHVDNNSSDGKSFDVAVVGLCNVDHISYVDKLPDKGETVRANRFHTYFGGKGANQCVAAAKLGSKTALISKVGNDDWGKKYRENLEKYNVCTTYIDTVNMKSTGTAQIIVAKDGENQIVIIPGANDSLTVEDYDKAQEIFDNSKVLVVQLETPVQISLAALRKFRDGISILNASPAPTENLIELYSLPTIICVNQVEAGAMTSRSVPNIDEAKRAVNNYLCLGVEIAIITMGKDGVVFASAEDPKPIHLRPPRVEEVLDTTGAGDAFVGALAHYMAKFPDIPLLRKVGGAVQIASMSVQQYGTQNSYPFGKDLRFDINYKNFDWNYIP